MCPARLILLPAGSRDDLAGERIAQVYASPAAEEDAARLADHLGTRLTVVPELLPATAPVLRAEAGAGEAIRRADDALRGIADQHRGETVVVVAPGLDLGIQLPAVIEHEGDGWSVLPTDEEV